MRRLLLLAAIAGGVVWSAGAARAEGEHTWWPLPSPDIHAKLGPKATSVTWPSVTPPGWYTDTYRHKWFYPWYAYYNYSQGPYANWVLGGGYAGYSYHGPAGMYYYPQSAAPSSGSPASPAPPAKPPEKKVEKTGTVFVTLPSDAKLLFNGVAADGTGGARTFQTPPLADGQDYQYELTAEVIRNGVTQRVTGTVIVRAGETAGVVLTPVPVVTASK